ncbi:alpha/beta fold hydrolase [Rhizobium multihospitium]|uniref:Pimeloyl-ACP methyl ester carboxylesterase n=1 Tax=Rhizobium multihospitium TaxID=410764 RepID=A0A1C3X290_9HYPH|nr:alpha/beta hydrolase [Rhizobium multihospitium]SCB46382.1 Pimeloyl-ACP methyl ester carboxylesterase [Rhizobium multihospitium]
MSAPDKPIVLVHGLFGSLSNPKILAAFGNADVHAPDLIGYGCNREADVSSLSLLDQARHIAGFISGLDAGKVHLVGHSVGGAVSVLVAKHFPQLVGSLTSVEGNFTLKDAFWSGQIAVKPDEEVASIISGYEADPDAWLAGAGVEINGWTSSLGRSWLANQPPSTIKAQAKAVVAATGETAYLDAVRGILQSGIPVYLIAGRRSAEGWDVPDWANALCTARINIAETGHLMMAESPDAFASAVLTCLSYR